MKLTAIQIGTLALICEQVTVRFPEQDPETLKDSIPTRGSDEFQMMPWEVALKEAINKEPTLPTYSESDMDSSLSDWVDQFMNYF